MKTVGIIAEYNPFHNGHCYHLRKSLLNSGAEAAVAVMSGNFMQRGEPALVEKWTRAEMALKNGVNLVMELPFAYACNSAEYFARGGIRLLNQTGFVTHISFGSELGSLEELQKIAKTFAYEESEYKSVLKDYLGEGISFPRARQKVIEMVLGNKYAEILRFSNNILAVEYLKQLMITDSNIIPVSVRRAGNGYLDREASTPFASAMAIRELMNKGEKTAGLVPLETEKILESLKVAPVVLEDFSDLIKYKLLTLTEEELTRVFDVNEGLESRIMKKLRSRDIKIASGIENMSPMYKTNAKYTGWTQSFIEDVVSKRYTETRIKRILIHLLLDFTKEAFNEMDGENRLYGRVLAADTLGLSLLTKAKKNTNSILPMIDNLSKNMETLGKGQKRMLELDIKAADIYNIATGKSVYSGSDFIKHKFLLEKKDR